MLVDLITEEIRNLYPQTGRIDRDKFFEDNNYTIHCSPVFLKKFVDSFKELGFQIPARITEEDMEMLRNCMTSFQSPQFGKVTLIPDLQQGYKIEKA